MRLADLAHDATVVGGTGRLAADDGRVCAAESNAHDPLRTDAEFQKSLTDGIGPGLGEPQVGAFIAGIIGVALDNEEKGRVSDQPHGLCLEGDTRPGAKLVAGFGEEDAIAGLGPEPRRIGLGGRPRGRLRIRRRQVRSGKIVGESQGAREEQEQPCACAHNRGPT